ncbi:MAG: IS110 family transposase [Acidimicrobiales bacterium]
MLHAGLDLSRRSLEVHLLAENGSTVSTMSVPPDLDGLRGLVRKVALLPGGRQVLAVIESMNGARFVHDTLELEGWQVEIADAAKVKGLAPLACKTDRIDAWVLAELSRRDLVPSIWLPDPATRSARELARWRLHLVRHRTALKNRVHATLVTFGHPCPVADLFGLKGRDLLRRLQFPEPWLGDLEAALRLIDTLNFEIATLENELKAEGADHPYVRLLLSVPGISWVLAYTIASEIGDISRFASPVKLCGYTGLCPRVYQSGQSDHRGALSKNGPKYLRWALIEAATHAASHPLYAERYQYMARRLGRQRGKKVARVDLARRLAEAIWHMLTTGEVFAPAGLKASKAAA